MAVRSDLCRCPPCTEPHLTGDHQVWGGVCGKRGALPKGHDSCQEKGGIRKGSGQALGTSWVCSLHLQESLEKGLWVLWERCTLRTRSPRAAPPSAYSGPSAPGSGQVEAPAAIYYF